MSSDPRNELSSLATDMPIAEMGAQNLGHALLTSLGIGYEARPSRDNRGVSVELFAANAVVDHIAACPRLTPDIKSGDKTPITEGHIDFYSSEKKNNKTHEGRVPVQVKGRVTGTKVKASRNTQSFPVEREVLQFFRNHGGGIYFYVPMRHGGFEREVF